LETDGQSCAAAITCARAGGGGGGGGGGIGGEGGGEEEEEEERRRKQSRRSERSRSRRAQFGAATHQHDQVRVALVLVGDLVPVRGHGTNGVPGLQTLVPIIFTFTLYRGKVSILRHMHDLDSALFSIILKGSRAAGDIEDFRHVVVIIFCGDLPGSQDDSGNLIEMRNFTSSHKDLYHQAKSDGQPANPQPEGNI
jgi:hypothetical protein